MIRDTAAVAVKSRGRSGDACQGHDLAPAFRYLTRRDRAEAQAPGERARIVFFSNVACIWDSCAFFERQIGLVVSMWPG